MAIIPEFDDSCIMWQIVNDDEFTYSQIRAVELAKQIHESFNKPKVERLYMCGGVVEMTYENEKEQDILNGVYREYRSKR